MSMLPVITIVIPCYRVCNHICDVIRQLPSFVSHVIVVDDKCPDQSGRYVLENVKDSRVHILYREKNGGVGAAVKDGYRQAILLDSDIVVKMDGDGQMSSKDLPHLLVPLLQKRADYVKGNRFENLDLLKKMPFFRLIGNSILSFLTKLSSGYWHVMDPTNGFTAIHRSALMRLSLNKISDNYFFESAMLQKLNQIQAVVEDVPIAARYGDEKSNLKIRHILGPFMKGHMKGAMKRIFRTYFLKDFNLGSLGLILGIPMVLFGAFYGLSVWGKSIWGSIPATSGTVMLCALPALLGIQLLLLFFQTDIENKFIIPLQTKDSDCQKTLSILNL